MWLVAVIIFLTVLYLLNVYSFAVYKQISVRQWENNLESVFNTCSAVLLFSDHFVIYFSKTQGFWAFMRFRIQMPLITIRYTSNKNNCCQSARKYFVLLPCRATVPFQSSQRSEYTGPACLRLVSGKRAAGLTNTSEYVPVEKIHKALIVT